MKKNVKMNVCMCMYDRSMLYTRNQHYASINKQTSKRGGWESLKGGTWLPSTAVSALRWRLKENISQGG